MKGSGIILSNRHKALLESMENFGDSIQGIRKAQQDAARQAKMDGFAANQDARAAATHTASMKQAANQDQLQGFALRQAGQQEQDASALRSNQAELAAVDSGLTPFGPRMPADETPTPFVDQNRNLRARLVASIESQQTGKPVRAQDIFDREDAAKLGAKQAAEDRALDIRTKTADATGKELGNRKSKLEIDKLEALAKNAGGAEMAITEENKGVWDKLFSGYRTDTQSTKDSLGQIRKLEALVNGVATGASDIATLYTFIRSFDSPNSAVREAEAQMGQEAAGALNKLMNLRAKYEKGRILPDNVRQEMLQAVQTIKTDHETVLGATNARYSRLAKAGGMDPSLIVDPEFMATLNKGAGASGGVKSFKSAKEAMAAGLPAGTRVMINGEEAEI